MLTETYTVLCDLVFAYVFSSFTKPQPTWPSHSGLLSCPRSWQAFSSNIFSHMLFSLPGIPIAQSFFFYNRLLRSRSQLKSFPQNSCFLVNLKWCSNPQHYSFLEPVHLSFMVIITIYNYAFICEPISKYISLLLDYKHL